MQRIALRDRPYERQMERDYIDELNQAYDAFYLEPASSTHTGADDRNRRTELRARPRDLRWIENRIRQELNFTLPAQFLPTEELIRAEQHENHPRNPAEIARDRRCPARAHRTVVCIYLTGSLLTEEPLLGGTTDIDLICVHRQRTAMRREIVRLVDEVHLDIGHFTQADFDQPRHLRQDPWLGPYLSPDR